MEVDAQIPQALTEFVADIVPRRFWTKYIRDANDAAKLKPVDYVEYSPRGAADRSTTISKISTIKDTLIPVADNSSPAVAMAHARWNAIRPSYEAWKRGEEMPEEGTPLSAWTAISHEQASVLKAAGVRTVEELSKLTSAHVDRINVPNLRSLIEQAKIFIESGDRNRITAHIEERQKQIETQQETIEMQQMEIDEMRRQSMEQSSTIKKLLEKVDALADALAAGDAAKPQQQQSAKK